MQLCAYCQQQLVCATEWTAPKCILLVLFGSPGDGTMKIHMVCKRLWLTHMQRTVAVLSQ